MQVAGGAYRLFGVEEVCPHRKLHEIPNAVLLEQLCGSLVPNARDPLKLLEHLANGRGQGRGRGQAAVWAAASEAAGQEWRQGTLRYEKGH